MLTLEIWVELWSSNVFLFLRNCEKFWPRDVTRIFHLMRGENFHFEKFRELLTLGCGQIFFLEKWWEFLPWFRWEFLSLRDVVKILSLRSFENFWFWNVVRGFSMKFFSLTSGEKFYPEKLRILYHEMWWEFSPWDEVRIFTLRCGENF